MLPSRKITINTDTHTRQKKPYDIIKNYNHKKITTAYAHKTKNNNKLDLYIDIDKIGFIDYKINDEVLKKIYINQISIDAYYQKNGFGSYLINCLKQEFDTITLLSIGKGLNAFYEKNNFEEDLLKEKQKNNTNYIWMK